jgi:hypothetical protein
MQTGIQMLKNKVLRTSYRWFTPIIPATWEVEIEGSHMRPASDKIEILSEK